MTVNAITDTKKGEQGLRLLIFILPDYTNDSVGNRIKYDYRRMDKDAILYELSMLD